MKKIHLLFLITLSILIFPFLVFADGGMVVWPPTIHLNQSAQNAIVAWNGSEEIIILSVNLESSGKGTVLRIIPLPSNPSEIKEGKFESFEKLVEIMNEKIKNAPRGLEEGEEAELKAGAPSGIEITFQKKIGAHDITVVKVNDLNYFLNWINDFAEKKGFQKKKISSEFKEGVANYLKKKIKYFVFDVIDTNKDKESIKPLIYKFKNDFLYYPILISGISEISESFAGINIFLITKKEVKLPDFPYSYYRYRWFRPSRFSVELSKEELKEVSKDISDLFEEKVLARKISIYGRLKDIKRDLMLFPSYLWDRSLTVGDKGESVKKLQQVLINEGVWSAEVEATGIFDKTTKTALANFQERYSKDILEPLGLKSGTGYFGPKSREYLKKISLLMEQKELSFDRNLFLGRKGEDVRALQEILIKEGVWERPDIGPTGFFGPITKRAVIKYQEKYASEILVPLGLTKGTGFVGPMTRKHLEERF